MNKKLVAVAIAGWLYAAVVVHENLKLRSDLKAQGEIIEEATDIVTAMRFKEIVDRFDDI